MWYNVYAGRATSRSTTLNPTSVPPEEAPNGWSEREMKRGRWRDVDAEGRPARADQVVRVRLTKAELAELDDAVERLGINRNRALRIAARRIGGFVEVDDEVRTALKDAVRQIGGIATNVNQLAKTANRTRDPDFVRFERHKRELGQAMMALDASVQDLLDVSRRRTDGLARLQDVAGGDGDQGSVG